MEDVEVDVEEAEPEPFTPEPDFTPFSLFEALAEDPETSPEDESPSDFVTDAACVFEEEDFLPVFPAPLAPQADIKSE